MVKKAGVGIHVEHVEVWHKFPNEMIAWIRKQMLMFR